MRWVAGRSVQRRGEDLRLTWMLLGRLQLTEPAAAAAAEKDGRMTKEQLGELAEALSILSAKSSIVKERDELKQLMSDNIASEEVSARRTVLEVCGSRR